MMPHEAVPGSKTCVGRGCGGKGPAHVPHPKFLCTCGMWYATERGRRAHLAKEHSWKTVKEAQALVTRAGYGWERFVPSATMEEAIAAEESGACGIDSPCTVGRGPGYLAISGDATQFFGEDSTGKYVLIPVPWERYLRKKAERRAQA
jgi:hypothetical protein